ncbi:MAG: translocation/assembly module TamB domain-containing protein [Bryobacteraceae bacterium]|nr:translocation/assembly module TamB domain-containing protein [Bryobacteraceae bacterium]
MRRWRRRLLVLGAVGLTAAVAVILVIQSAWFHDRVRERVVLELEKATGARIEFASFAFDWKTGRIDIRGLVLHGAEPASAQPLFRADQLVIGLHLPSLIDRKVNVRSVALTRPAVNIIVSPDGTTNLPVPPGARAGGDPIEDILNLAIDSVEVKEATLRYDSQTIPLSLNTGAFRATLRFDRSGPRYTGDFAVTALRLAAQGIDNIELQQIESGIILEKGIIAVPGLRLASGQSTLIAKGELRDFKALTAVFDVNTTLAIAELSRRVTLPIEPTGTVKFQGSVQLSRQTPIALTGALQTQGIAWRYRGVLVPGISLVSNLDWRGGAVELEQLRVQALEGSMKGAARFDGGRFSVAGDLDGLSLQRVVQFGTGKALPWSSDVAGTVKAEGRIANGRLSDALADASLRLAAAAGGSPLDGAIELSYRQREGRLSLGQSFLETPVTRLNFDGALGETLKVFLITSDIEDLRPALSLVTASAPESLPVALKHGELRFDGSVSGPLRQPVVTGRASARRLFYQDREFETIQLVLDASSSALVIRSLTARQGSAHIEANGRAVLEDWRMTDSTPLSGEFRIRSVDLRQWADAYGIAGATGRVAGTTAQPRIAADVTIDGPGFANERFDSARARLSATRDRVEVTNGSLLVAGAPFAISGVYEPSRTTIRVKGAGAPLARLEAVREWNPDFAALLDLDLDAEAQLTAKSVRLTAVNGRAAVRNIRLGEKRFGSGTVDAATKGDTVSLNATANLLNADLRGGGALRLADGYPAQLRFSLGRLPFAALEPLTESKSLPFAGHLSGEASLDGPLADSPLKIRLADFELRPKTEGATLVVRNQGPLQLALDRKGLRFEQAVFVAPETEVNASGVLAFGQRSPWDLRLKGRMNLAVLNSFKPDLIASGSSTVDAAIRGSLLQPQFGGRMELSNAAFYLRGVPNGIDQANGLILFDRNRANIERLTAQTGGGQIQLSGFLGLSGGELFHRLQGQLTKVRIRYPEGVSTTVDANLNLSGTVARSLLGGSITIARSGITPRTDLASLLGEATRAVQAPPSQNEFLQGLQFDVRIDTAPDVQVQTTLTRDIQLDARLHLRGSPAKPVLLGGVTIDRGEIQFFGTKYTINRGEISFFNPAKIEPVLDMDVETRVRAVTVNINFAGPMDKLNVNYRADPPLQLNEIIALLTVGRAPLTADPNSELRQTASTVGQGGANSLLGAAVSAPVTGRLQRFFGVSRLKIDPQLNGIDNTPQARLTIEQQISRDVTLTYVTNLSRTQQQLVRFEWNLTSNWSVIAVRDENGVFGVDFQVRRRFR